MVSTQSSVILVIGAPGAGKGTLCKKLAKEFNLRHISVGDTLRLAASGPDADKTLVDHVERSTLLPTAALFSILRPHLAQPSNEASVTLLDGLPRRLDQAEAFDCTFCTPLLVCFFDCPENVARMRVVQRKQGREGDNLEIFQKRYNEFSELNPPIVHHYKAKNILITIDTSQSTETSYIKFIDALKAREEWKL